MEKPLTVYLEAGKHFVSAAFRNKKLVCVVRTRRSDEPAEEYELISTDGPAGVTIAEIKER